MSSTKPLRVLVTGAGGQIGYSLLPIIASGAVFGPDAPVILHLLDIPPVVKKVEGVKMELDDCAYPLLRKTIVFSTDDLKGAFTDVDAAFLVGGFPRGPGMDRVQLLAKNAPIFVGQGQALNAYASRKVKVLVVANPANTNCYILRKNAPDLPDSAFCAMTYLDMQRSLAQISIKADVPVSQVRNVVIFGNHSNTMVVSTESCVIHTDGKDVPATTHINDSKWFETDFTKTVQTRGKAIIDARGFSSALSAAQAAANHMKKWFVGTEDNEMVSFAVYSDGKHYGVSKDIVYSFPVRCKNGEYEVVDDLTLSAATKAAMKVTETELISERADAETVLQQQASAAPAS